MTLDIYCMCSCVSAKVLYAVGQDCTEWYTSESYLYVMTGNSHPAILAWYLAVFLMLLCESNDKFGIGMGKYI